MVKAKKKGLSVHSRAARRGATSPPPKNGVVNSSTVETTDYKPWLHNTHSAGISKKKKAKSMSRQQRSRQRNLAAHAERNMDKLEKKIADSKTRGKKVQARAKDWDELNDGLNMGEKPVLVARKERGDGRQMEGIDTSEIEQESADGDDDAGVDEVINQMEMGAPSLEPARVPLPASDEARKEDAMEAVDDIS